MVANAVLSIVSAVIGGGLVLAGQFFVKRAENKRVWLIRWGRWGSAKRTMQAAAATMMAAMSSPRSMPEMNDCRAAAASAAPVGPGMCAAAWAAAIPCLRRLQLRHWADPLRGWRLDLPLTANGPFCGAGRPGTPPRACLGAITRPELKPDRGGMELTDG